MVSDPGLNMADRAAGGSTPPQLILFDFDGTLADSSGATLAIANRLSRNYGYASLSETEAAHLRNSGIREILRQSRVPLRRLPSWMREVRKELAREIPAMSSPAGLTDTLFALKETGVLLGIVTSNSRENVQLFLQTQGWSACFEFLECGSNLFGKNRLIKRAFNRAGLSAFETCYVGDEVRDIEAARRARVTSVAVTWGFNSREILTRSQPDQLLDHPSQLLRLVGS